MIFLFWLALVVLATVLGFCLAATESVKRIGAGKTLLWFLPIISNVLWNGWSLLKIFMEHN